MSKNINVNPNFYKTGGREHAEADGEAILYEREKREMSESDPSPGSLKAQAIARARSHAKKK